MDNKREVSELEKELAESQGYEFGQLMKRIKHLKVV